MFEKILIPTDFSKYSQKVLECVTDLPGVKEVVLLHVIAQADHLARIRDFGSSIQESKEKLAELKNALESRNLSVKTIAEAITEGDISEAIQKVADEEKISLIAMGARGKSIVEGIFLGNVAKNILRFGNTNILLLRYAVLEGREGPNLENICPQLYSKVLCPIDFSISSAQALEFIKEIGGVEEIILLHVIVRGETWGEINTSKEEADKKLMAMSDDFQRAGIRVKTYTSVGHPEKEICDLARKENVSLIAMSSHGKDWLKQLMIGSTTYEVTRLADRPVLVIKSVQMF